MKSNLKANGDNYSSSYSYSDIDVDNAEELSISEQELVNNIF